MFFHDVQRREKERSTDTTTFTNSLFVRKSKVVSRTTIGLITVTSEYCSLLLSVRLQLLYINSTTMADQNNEAPKPSTSTEAPPKPAKTSGGDKTCYNCGKSGHVARDCQGERLEGDARQVINKARAQYRRCFNCGKTGHISADCTKPQGNKGCYNCGEDGHIARECPQPRSTE